MARDSKSMTDLVDYFDEVTPEQVQKVRLLICANAIGDPETMVDDATTLIRMLGLHPDQANEDEFGNEKYRLTLPKVQF